MTTIPGHADWREAGACAQLDPDLFFPISSTGPARDQIAKAKAICGACPVRRPCLEFALEHDLAHGIWGGTTPQDRQARRRGRRPEPLRTVSLSADARPGSGASITPAQDQEKVSAPSPVNTTTWRPAPIA